MFNPLSKLFGSGKATVTDQEAPASDQPAQQTPDTSLSEAVEQTSQSLVGKIFNVFKGNTPAAPGTAAQAATNSESGVYELHPRLLDAETLDEQIDQIEEILLRADVGLDTAVEITDKLREHKGKLKTVQDVLVFLRQEFSAILSPYEKANHLAQPTDLVHQGKTVVYLVVGVNGAGKTTFIGKMAHCLIQQGQNVVIGAGDTFRAAAVEQLEVWAKRAGAKFVGGPDQGDPAAVIFDALKTARDSGAQAVLLDTAGRLQNKFNLMEELRKIRRVIDKDVESHPDTVLESLLVLDATTGQNALKQAEVFKEAVDLSGVILTKLDGSAKGGVILSIARDFKLPVKMVGTGEKITDLKPFDSSEFINALFSKH